jgi:thioredoxin-related protein
VDNLKNIFLSVALCASFSFGCDLNWTNSLAMAKTASVTTKKPIMVFVSSPTCPYCTMMSETTLQDKTVCELVNAKFIPLIVSDGSSEMPKNAKVRGVPTILFVDSVENEVAQRVIGLRSRDDFLNDLKQRNFQR